MILFVWDFHGVMEKDNEKSVIEISNAVLKERGYSEQFTPADNEKYYGLKWFQYFEQLLPNDSRQTHMDLQQACFTYAEQHLQILARNIKPNDHVLNVLQQLEESGNHQLVISNTRQGDLIWFLEAIGAKQFFSEERIIGVNAHQTHGSKLDALKTYLSDKKYEDIIAIGDSESDLALGKAVGAMTYFYKHPHREHENTENADYLITDLREVLSHPAIA